MKISIFLFIFLSCATIEETGKNDFQKCNNYCLISKNVKEIEIKQGTFWGYGHYRCVCYRR